MNVMVTCSDYLKLLSSYFDSL